MKALFIHFKHFCDCFECTQLLYSYHCAAHKPLLGLSSCVLCFTPVVPLNQNEFAKRCIIPYFCASKSMGLSNTAFFYGFVVPPTGCVCRAQVHSAVLIYLCISTGFTKYNSIPKSCCMYNAYLCWVCPALIHSVVLLYLNINVRFAEH